MSIGLAIMKIAQHTGAIETLSGKIAEVEGDYIKAVASKDDSKVKETLAYLTQLKTLLGMAKDFVEFWKDLIKSILSLLKSFNELAQGSR